MSLIVACQSRGHVESDDEREAVYARAQCEQRIDKKGGGGEQRGSREDGLVGGWVFGWGWVGGAAFRNRR